MKKLLMTVAILLSVSGCTTIHFDKTDTVNLNATKTEDWHHNALLALVEVSDPVNLEEKCGDQEWTSVKTELTFANGFFSGLINFIVPVWYPKTVEVSCI